MIIKTSELEGAALDWAVAKAKGWFYDRDESGPTGDYWFNNAPIHTVDMFKPSTDWSEGGPIIDSRNIGFTYLGDEWTATLDETSIGCGDCGSGATHLIADMRAIVAAELGDSVDVPEELVG